MTLCFCSLSFNKQGRSTGSVYASLPGAKIKSGPRTPYEVLSIIKETNMTC